MTQIDVMIYTLSTCPWCHRSKRFFDERGVPFRFLDVDTAAPPERERAVATVKEMTGSLQYPVVVINGGVVQGYDPDGFADLLEKCGWQPRSGD